MRAGLLKLTGTTSATDLSCSWRFSTDQFDVHPRGGAGGLQDRVDGGLHLSVRRGSALVDSLVEALQLEARPVNGLLPSGFIAGPLLRAAKPNDAIALAGTALRRFVGFEDLGRVALATPGGPCLNAPPGDGVLSDRTFEGAVFVAGLRQHGDEPAPALDEVRQVRA